MLKSWSKYKIHWASQEVFSKFLYSGSKEEREITNYFFHFQLMMEETRKK